MDKVTVGVAGLSVSGPASMAPKIGAGAKPDGRGGSVELMANMYPLQMSSLPVYRYDVEIAMKLSTNKGASKDVSLVKKTIDDFMVVDNKDKCRAVFKIAVRKFGQVFGNPRGLFYDLQSLLYCIDQIKDETGKEISDVKEMVIKGEDLKGVAEFEGRKVDSVVLRIKPVDTNFQLTLGDLSYVKKGLEANMNHDLAQFLELVTSQRAYQNPSEFVTYSSGISYMLKPVVKQLPGGKQLMNGVQKSVRVIEGPGTQPVAAVVVDAKKTAFHKAEMTVADKVYEMGLMKDDGTVLPGNIAEIDKQLKHLYVKNTHGNPRRFEIVGCDAKSARDMKFESEDGMISVEQYMKKRYGVVLDYPRAPLAVAKGRKTGESGSSSKKIYFPMELLEVCPNQRVTTKQQTPKQISEMIRSCAVLPSDRARDIKRHVTALGLTTGSATLAAAQLQIANDMIRLQGRALAPPEIKYNGSKQFPVDPNTGKWRTGPQKPQFLMGASINKWGMFFLTGRPYPNDERVVKTFHDLMLTECKQRGMNVKPAAVFKTVGLNELENTFKQAQSQGFEFMFFVQDSRLQLHKDMKHLERRYEIITQDLNLNTCKSVVEQRKMLSLENIINKTNVKMGGINYSLVVKAPNAQNIFGKGRLYIGFQVSHAAPLSQEEVNNGVLPRQPTIVGAAGNITQEPGAFVGDILFQTPRSDDMEFAMKKLVKEFAERYKTNVKCPPSEVVIYRNGASEGQLLNLVNNEIPAIRSALKDAGAGTAKLTVIVVSKLHNVRLMPSAMNPNGKAPEQNVKPGTVVDTTIVHPAFAEFYLNSHQTLQGSAKTPKYTVIVDDSKFPMSYMELMTYVLSYGHQIVGLPTSLPTPAYVAGRYAERGAMLLQAAKNDGDINDFEKLSKDLSYGTSKKIGDKRINA